MKRFKIEGEFPAENIDDAFLRLASHFLELFLNREETDPFGGPYRLVVEPLEQDTE